MSHRIFQDLYDAFSNNVAQVKDPNTEGSTIVVGNKGYAIVELDSTDSGAGDRVLEDATNLQVGVKVLVVLDVDGGSIDIESDDGDVTLTAPGDFAEFVVSKANGVNVWRVGATHLT
jgi:hypothetical protein